MLWPKVVGQSGTARAAPVLVTRPPKTISTQVAAAVSTASRCVRLTRRALSSGAGRPRTRPSARRPARPPPPLREGPPPPPPSAPRPLPLRQIVLGRLGIAVL